MLMLDAQKGTLVKDMFIGGPLNETPTIGATVSGQMEIIVPITAGAGLSWGAAVPGNLVALSLQNVPAATTNVVTTTTTASAATVTTTVGGGSQTVTQTTTVATTIVSPSTGVDPTVLYGVAAVAVIFIIGTGFFAMKSRRRPAP
jgi:hypothetical protein